MPRNGRVSCEYNSNYITSHQNTSFCSSSFCLHSTGHATLSSFTISSDVAGTTFFKLDGGAFLTIRITIKLKCLQKNTKEVLPMTSQAVIHLLNTYGTEEVTVEAYGDTSRCTPRTQNTIDYSSKYNLNNDYTRLQVHLGSETGGMLIE